ncbi:DEAD/DEAH box helicase [[Clostridium] polysaccharolyticum]|uniref:AAA domain-containing protein n=1 Tax=[Clostridium] polysaccharolyticum TaxID=29364 RepID=A0A1H9Y9W8_9FIRM|nr:AAA domain-containing protein [[Clostridium] polysaccharolyticum]SES65589.1 AAA domain-containing protein [[Clostridium] polysaccharolyticum]
MDKTQLASKIISFWNMVEFLDQKEFPKEKPENKKIVRDEQKFSRGEIQVKRRRVINLFHEITPNTDLEQIFKEDKRVFLRNQWLSQKKHVCIARIKRNMCESKIDELLHIQEYEGNKDQSDIALIGFRVSSQGQYEEKTFSLSPLIWGIMMIYKYGSEARSKITQEEYVKCIEIYEQYLMSKGIVSAEVMNELVDKINQDYMLPLFNQKAECKGVLIYHLYATKEDMEKRDGNSDDYSALARSYYTNDLLLVKGKIESGAFGNYNKMQKNVIDYIVSQVEGIPDREDKVDIRMERKVLEQVLAPDKMPIGKWPSEYTASFMQQVAINLALSSRNSTYPIFSVNGPPGTGKTTLLKEIIVSNIIERAKLLAEYKNPDDAFYECYFHCGTLKNHGYDNNDCCYYRFKNEKINDYGMLVASNNNAAVENITRELPNGENLCKGLRNSKDNPGLEEIEKMFDLSKVTNTEIYSVKVDQKKSEKISIEKPDIYFSWLAHRLLTKSEVDTEVFREWGMLSAPLGKALNIEWFGYYVLNPLINEFMNGRERAKHQMKYKAAVDEFRKQLHLVQGLQEQMEQDSCLEERYNHEIKQLNEQINLLTHKISIAEQNIDAYRHETLLNVQQLEQVDTEIARIRAVYNEYTEKENVEKQHLDSYNVRIQSIEQCVIDLEKKMNLKDNFLHLIGKKTERVKNLEAAKSYREQQQLEMLPIQKRLAEIEVIKNRLNSEWQNQREKRNWITNNQSVIEQKVRNSKVSIVRFWEELEECRRKVALKNQKYEKDKQSIKEKWNAPDEEFWDDYYSDDNKRNIRAQIKNIWHSNELDRAREKLFYYALQVHKEFILASKAVRSNFVNLAYMWNQRCNSKGDSVRIIGKDRNDAFSHLFNTLFLFVPVISTTFASVQTFFRDIIEPGKLGMLIVDEAGQALPHIALGALYRCRQAVIVGDPKQVEPVVTTSIKHMRKIFEDEILHPYIVSDMLSVQNFADKINPFGSYIVDDEDTGKKEWVGCPLVVHRRCIEPMFSISNQLSYGNTMKNQTKKPDENSEISKCFILQYSYWSSVTGNEISTSSKNHYVPEQGEKALKIISAGFEKYNGIPDLYVISPFTSVVNELKSLVMDRMENTKYKQEAEKWCRDNCGTVHKFQGKEAAEVIFLLGCDKNSKGAVDWVKSNIVNVAVTRAKYRLYVIGDYEVWEKNKCLKLVYERVLECKKDER